jgi:hypothetical protein
MNRVFVYGALKLGQRNDHFLRELEFDGHFTTEPSYSMYGLNRIRAFTSASRFQPAMARPGCTSSSPNCVMARYCWLAAGRWPLAAALTEFSRAGWS